MAAKDKICGNNLVALKDLDLGAWFDNPHNDDEDDADIDCNDLRWIGAPDPTDDLTQERWGLRVDPCADALPHASRIAWFQAWYILSWYVQCCYLVLIILVFIAKEKAIKARKMARRHRAAAAAAVATPARVIILQTRVEKRLLCGVLTLWKRLVDEILWAPGGKRFREHSLTCAAAAAMQA
eukprot:scaffold38449_cov60-Phaeocystis_antarctica.AAC.1